MSNGKQQPIILLSAKVFRHSKAPNKTLPCWRLVICYSLLTSGTKIHSLLYSALDVFDVQCSMCEFFIVTTIESNRTNRIASKLNRIYWVIWIHLQIKYFEFDEHWNGFVDGEVYLLCACVIVQIAGKT